MKTRMPAQISGVSTEIERPSAIPLLLKTRFSGQELGPATGFIVDSAAGPVLITCRHVLTGRDNDTGKPLASSCAIPNQIVIAHNGGSSPNHLDKIVNVIQPLHHKDGSPRWYEHPTLGGAVDIVALPVFIAPEIQFVKSSLGIGDPELVCRPSEPISVIGFPFGRTAPGQFAIWATGFIASELSIAYDGKRVFLIDCRSRPGQSGAPVIAYRASSAAMEDGSMSICTADPQARFLGVYSGRIHPDSDIGMVWHASVVRELVNAIPPACPIELRSDGHAIIN